MKRGGGRTKGTTDDRHTIGPPNEPAELLPYTPPAPVPDPNVQLAIARVTIASDNTAFSVNATATGPAAHDAAVSGNPLLAGAEARTSNGTAVANGDLKQKLTVEAKGEIAALADFILATFVGK